jgi:hypothetical protein
MLVLLWLSTRNPLISRFLPPAYVNERKFPFANLFFFSEGLPFLSAFVKVGIGVVFHGSVWFGIPCCSFPWMGMEPNWNDVKKIIHRHEEISQANNNALQHISTKMVGMEQAIETYHEPINN